MSHDARRGGEGVCQEAGSGRWRSAGLLEGVLTAARGEVTEDLIDQGRVGDERHDGHLDAALRAKQRVDFQDWAEQPCPGGAAAVLLGRKGLLVVVVGRFVAGRVAGAESACGAGARGVGAVVAHEVLAAVGDLAGDGVDPLQGIENQVGRAALRVRRRGDPDSAFLVDVDCVDADRLLW